MNDTLKRINDICRHNGISFAALLTLSHIERKGSETMTVLADINGVTTAAMTGIIDRLISKTRPDRVFVTRSFRDTEDRRKIVVKLTDRGKEVVMQLIQVSVQAAVKRVSKHFMITTP